MPANKKLVAVLSFFLIWIVFVMGQIIFPKEWFSFLPYGMRTVSETMNFSIEKVVDVNKILDVAEEIYKTGTIADEEDGEVQERITDYFGATFDEADYKELKKQCNDFIWMYIGIILVFILLIALFGGGIFLAIALPKRCKKCKKWFSIKKDGKKYLHDDTTTKKGTVIYTYKTDYKCKCCGDAWVITQRIEKDI